MKITTYASAAVIAFAMSMGTASAEEQFSVMKDVPSATTMTVEQLGETVGAALHELHDCEVPMFKRRWFHRRGMRNGCGKGCDL